MATIPIYTKQVEEQALPGARQQSIASPALFDNSQNAQTLGKGLSAIGDVAQQYQDKEDTALTSKGEAGMLSEFTDFKIQARKREGLNASGLVEEADKFYNDTVAKYIKNAPNNRIAQALQAIADKHMPGFRGYVGGHAAEQNGKAVEEETKANIIAQINSAAADPAAAPEALKRITAAVTAQAQAQGKDSQTAALMVQAETTKLHLGVLETLQQNDKIDEAKAYYYSHKNTILGDHQAKIEKALELGGRLQESQKAADDLMAKVRGGELDYAKAEAFARENYTGEKRKEVIAQLRDQQGAEDRFKKDIEEKALAPVQSAIGDAINAKRSIGAAAKTAILAPLKTQPELYLKASQAVDQHNDEMLSKARSAASHARAMSNDSMDKTINDLLVKQDIIINPDKYKNVDLKETLLPLVKEKKISAATVNEVLSLQEKYRNPKNAPELATLQTGAGYLESRLQGSVVDGKPFSELKKKKQAEIKARAITTLEPILQQYQERVGEKASQVEVKKLVDNLFVDKKYRSTVLGIAYGEAFTRTEADFAGVKDRSATAVRVPQALRARISNALRKNGIEPTETSIQEYYLAGQK